MKFVCNRENLLKIVAAGEVVSSAKIEFSSAAMTLLRAAGSEVQLKASNLSVTLEAPLECDVETEGAISVNQTRLASLLKELQEEKIKLELRKENLIHIAPVAGKRKLQVELYGVPPTEFPELPSIDARRPFIAIERAVFRKMIAQTAFAAAANPTQYALNGVYMTYEAGKFSMVTTDGRRMAIYHHTLGKSEHEPFKVILARDFLRQFQRTLLGDGPLSFAIADNRIFLKMNEMLITSLFIDGDYPNYQSFIPATYKHQLTISTILFKHAIKTLLAAYTNIELSFNKILLSLSKDKLKITSRTKNAAHTDEELPCRYDGEHTKLAFNVKMLNEIIEHINEGELSISWNDHSSPVLFKGLGTDECHYILMPVKEADF